MSNNLLKQSSIGNNQVPITRQVPVTRQVATMTNNLNKSKGFNLNNLYDFVSNEFSNKKTKIIIILLISSVVFGLAYYYFFIYDSLSKYRVVILPKTTPRNIVKAKEKVVYPTSYGILPGDTEMTYSMWIKVEDFTYNYGLIKHIFSYSETGNSDGSPAIYMDSTDNSFIISINLVNDQKKKINIHNIPVKRWFHLVMTIAGDIVHIYINGELISSHAMGAYIKPLPNGKFYFNSKVITGASPGFGGKISKFEYFNRSLIADDVYTVYREGNISNKKPSRINRKKIIIDYDDEDDYDEEEYQ
jgi:hypothetical protein